MIGAIGLVDADIAGPVRARLPQRFIEVIDAFEQAFPITRTPRA
jgi:hypothetical protein